jgi:large subunit ribosomal protein L4
MATATKKAASKSADAAKVITVSLPAEIFDVATNIPLIHQVVVAQQAAARQGTHSTKRRGEVRGGGKKPYKQKGTGRARQGSTRAPQFVGGGIVHGPKPRDYSERTPKKMKAAALKGALSDRARDGRIHVVEALSAGDKPSTKSAVTLLNSLSGGRRQLIVLQRDDALTWLSLRNVLSDDVIFTKGAYNAFIGVEAEEVEVVVEKPAKKAAAKKAAPEAEALEEVVVEEPAAQADAESTETEEEAAE